MDALLLGLLGFLAVVIISNPLENPIANMYGPHFLLFYGSIITVTLIACWQRLHHDSTTHLYPPLVPSQPDPYQIAYLRGGEREVTQLATFDLIQQGYLQVTGKLIEKASEPPDPMLLTALERQVFNWFDTPRAATAIADSSLPAKVKLHCTAYERWLQIEQLRRPDEIKTVASRLGWIGTLMILGLGGYKFTVALLKGHYNVGFLFGMAIFSLICLFCVCAIARTRRLSDRGRKYLKRLQQAFAGLKQQVTQNQSHSEPVLLMAIFGTLALAGTPYDYYPKMFVTAAPSSDGFSDSSSSCSSSSGSSCGSSCGGGSCGGCGGCGG